MVEDLSRNTEKPIKVAVSHIAQKLSLYETVRIPARALKCKSLYEMISIVTENFNYFPISLSTLYRFHYLHGV